MRTETALRMVRDRERVLVEILEDERSQGMPERFDWAAWRLNQADLLDSFNEAREGQARAEAAWQRHLDLIPRGL